MKRLQLLTGAALLCMLALMFAIFCTEVKFDNPLDEKEKGKSDNAWLWVIKEEDCQDQGISYDGSIYKNCGDYIRNNIFITDSITRASWEHLFKCVDGTIGITLEGFPNTVTLDSNAAGANNFLKLMGKTSTWEGVVKPTPGASVEAVLKDKNGDPLDDQNKMPPIQNDPYTIEYTATLKKCRGEGDMTDKVSRLLYIREDEGVGDTVKPKITLCTGWGVANGGTLELNKGVSFNDNCVSTSGGGEFTRKYEKNGKEVNEVNTDDTGTYNITYKHCKDGYGCDEVKITVKVKATGGGDDNPVPVIVLEKYTYNLGSGKTFKSPDTGFGQSGTFKDKGYSAYYTLDGNKEDITDAVKPQIPNSFDPNNTNGNPVTYKIEASDGYYKEKQESRTVYIPAEFCDGSVPAAFTFLPSPGGDITIPKGVPWSDKSQKESFRAMEDYRPDGANLRLYNFGVDFDISGSDGKLDPNNPQPGTYKIAYIAMSRCSDVGGSGIKLFRSDERTVKVND